MSAYKTCKRCGLRHSTLAPHVCTKVKERAGKFDGELGDPDADGPGVGNGVGGSGQDQGEGQGDGQSEGQGEGQGQGEGKGKGQGEGEGEPQEGDGDPEEGEGEGEGSGQGQGSAEPPPPPAAVVVTVLKFAALTAACRESFINVTLSDKGLVVFGQNGDNVAMETIPWGEFEKRSTIDGEYYVKSVIDAVDYKVGGHGHVAELEAELAEVLPNGDGSIDWSLPICLASGRAMEVITDEGEGGDKCVGTMDGGSLTAEEVKAVWPDSESPDRRFWVTQHGVFIWDAGEYQRRVIFNV